MEQMVIGSEQHIPPQVEDQAIRLEYTASRHMHSMEN